MQGGRSRLWGCTRMRCDCWRIDDQSPLLVAQIYDDLGRKDEAQSSRERGIELAEEHLQLNPDDARAVYMAANGMAALGQRDRGREWAERAHQMRPTD